ncbi:MAG TPA: GntR family transcriptional regulator [Clostridia bacterium]|nr:GntR family transcriptional regulator [Clostridia bacterium]
MGINPMEHKKTLKEEIRNQIIDRVVAGEFNSDSILTEKMLTSLFAVSKAPVREALIELCNEKILQSIPRCGYRIVRLTPRDIAQAVEVRSVLEFAAFDKMAACLSPEMTEPLKCFNVECDRSRISADVWTHWNNNREFHLLLAGLCGNLLLIEMLGKTLGLLSRAYAQSYWEEWHDSLVSLDIEKHKLIVAALEQGKIKTARSALQTDLQLMAKRFHLPGA